MRALRHAGYYDQGFGEGVVSASNLTSAQRKKLPLHRYSTWLWGPLLSSEQRESFEPKFLAPQSKLSELSRNGCNQDLICPSVRLHRKSRSTQETHGVPHELINHASEGHSNLPNLVRVARVAH